MRVATAASSPRPIPPLTSHALPASQVQLAAEKENSRKLELEAARLRKELEQARDVFIEAGYPALQLIP